MGRWTRGGWTQKSLHVRLLAARRTDGRPIAFMERPHCDCIRSIFHSAARPPQRNASRTQTRQWKGSLRESITHDTMLERLSAWQVYRGCICWYFINIKIFFYILSSFIIKYFVCTATDCFILDLTIFCIMYWNSTACSVTIKYMLNWIYVKSWR